MADDANKSTEPQTVSLDEFNRVKSRAERFEAQVADYEKRFAGVNLDELKAAKDERDILARQLADKDGKTEDIFKRAEESVGKRFNDKLTALQAETDSLRGKLKDHKVIATTITEAAKVFHAEAIPLIETVIRKELDLDNDEIVVKNEKGEPRYSKADPNRKMTVSEYVEELAGRFPFAARAEGATGGKQSTSKSGVNGGRKLTYDDLKAMPAAQQKEAMAGMTPAEIHALVAAK